MKVKKTVTPAVRERNQKNAQKSPGPTSLQGKAVTRFNSVKHGLTARYLLSSPEELAANPDLMALVEDLRSRYLSIGVLAEVLIDSFLVDVWRQKKGLEAEKRLYAEVDWPFGPQGSIANVHRYNTANRRAMLRNLELLEKLNARSASEQEEESEQDAATYPTALEEESFVDSAGDIGEGGNQAEELNKSHNSNPQVEHCGNGDQEPTSTVPSLPEANPLPGTMNEMEGNHAA
jgi:hypothetical protein